MRTVLIDDDYISVFLTSKLLEREGLGEGLRSFQSSEEGLQYLLEGLPNEVPDVLLLDLNMPVLNGWDFLAALQPHEDYLAGHCQVYILTSSLAPADAARARSSSLVTGFIHKPLDSAQIQVIRAQFIER